MKIGLNRTALVREWRKAVRLLKLKPDDVVVSSGGALVLYGIRGFTNDLDLDVPEAIFRRIHDSGKYQTDKFGDTEICMINDLIDIHALKLDPSQIYTMDDGVPTYSLAALLAFKERIRAMPTRKPEKIAQDDTDIAAIKKLMASGRYI